MRGPQRRRVPAGTPLAAPAVAAPAVPTPAVPTPAVPTPAVPTPAEAAGPGSGGPRAAAARRRGRGRAHRLAGPLALLTAAVLAADVAVASAWRSRTVVSSRPAATVSTPASTRTSVVRGPAVVGRAAPPVPDPGAVAPPSAVAALATGPSVAVSASPGGPVLAELPNPTRKGALAAFLVRETRPGWVRVLLPVRPNGRTGWVPAGQVRLEPLRYAITVSESAHLVRLWQGAHLVRTFPTAVGKPATPTPQGLFYVDVIYDNTADPYSPYGPWVTGLSGFSEVYTTFGIGDAEIAFHGTDEDYTVGTSASHGCMRLHNADATWLAHTVSLGTPVYIRG